MPKDGQLTLSLTPNLSLVLLTDIITPSDRKVRLRALDLISYLEVKIHPKLRLEG